MTLADRLRPADILLDVSCRSRRDLFELIADRIAGPLQLDPGRILAGFLHRESLGATAIGRGVALPHAAIAGLAGGRPLFLRLAAPMDFDAGDRAPVDVVLALVFPPPHNRLVLPWLSRHARRLSAPGLLRGIREATCPDRVHAMLTRSDPTPATPPQALALAATRRACA